jgi:hypothetical protein
VSEIVIGIRGKEEQAEEGHGPLVAVEAVKERRARGEEVRTTRARREPCDVSVCFL